MGYQNVEGYKRISEHSEFRITTLSRYKLAKPAKFTFLNCFKNYVKGYVKGTHKSILHDRL